jgi:hypothetical protein
MRLLLRNGTASVPPKWHEGSQPERSLSFGYFDKLPPLPSANSNILNAQSETRGIARERQGRHQSLNVGSMHPPQTQGKVQSAVRLALSGMYQLQASARTMTGLER